MRNIIKIYRIKIIEVIKKNIIYISLIRRGAIRKSERKYFIFIDAIARTKYYELFRVRVHLYSMKDLLNIEFYEDLYLSKASEYLIN